jgi:hypothetical protein
MMAAGSGGGSASSSSAIGSQTGRAGFEGDAAAANGDGGSWKSAGWRISGFGLRRAIEDSPKSGNIENNAAAAGRRSCGLVTDLKDQLLKTNHSGSALTDHCECKK